MLQKDTRWFADARFGLFIHWGLYAQPGGLWKGQEMEYIGEWIQSRFRIPNAEYGELAKTFNPALFDADEWISAAAKAGIKYLVYTAKHHDGFAMYHSRVSPYNIYDGTPFKRDPLEELAKACDKYGVRLGIYYSHHLDWHEADGGDPGPDWHKNAGNMSWGNDWDFPDFSKKDFRRYFEGKCLPQIKELFTNYGDISVLWCDCFLNIKPEFSQELRDLVKSLQPKCMINSRIGNNCGDYGSLGDNQQPVGLANFPRESPVTINRTWGFKWKDNNWKTPETAARELVRLAARNANYLLNIGPRPDGRFPQPAMEFLDSMAKWMDTGAGRGIYATRPNPFPNELPFGWCTAQDRKLHLFIDKWKAGPLELSGIRNKVLSAAVPYKQEGGNVTLELPEIPPKSILPLITLELDGGPDIDQAPSPQAGSLILAASKGLLVHGNSQGVGKLAGVDASGEKIITQPHSVVDRTGGVLQWDNPADSIEWNVKFPRGGKYAIFVNTETPNWGGATWAGGRKVEVALGTNKAEAELAETEVVKEAYKTLVWSRVSEFDIAEGFAGTLTLRTSEVLDKACGRDVLVAVEIRAMRDRTNS